MGESASMTATTIASLCLICQGHFRMFHDTLRTVDKDNGLPSTAVQNELGRFRVWASNIGAMRTGRLSLEYRLKDADYLYEDVTSLLEDTIVSLKEGLS
jgi:hypothetical protein